MGSWSCIILGSHADVAELVDALASGASVRKYVKVQVLSSAPEIITGFGWFFDASSFIALTLLVVVMLYCSA